MKQNITLAIKIQTLLIVMTVLFAWQPVSSQIRISPAFEKAFQQATGTGEYIEAIIYLNSQADLISIEKEIKRQKISNSERGSLVINELQNTARIGQSDVLLWIEQTGKRFPGLISEVKSFWIRNAIFIKARPAFYTEIMQRDDIDCIDLNYGKFYISEPRVERGNTLKTTSAPEAGILAINAPALWAMGYTGRNTILLSMDTGVWTDHPALAEAYLGNHFPASQCWYGVRSSIPMDHASSSHGTHTTGTVLGLDPTTHDTIGVAYNAYFMATDPVASSNSDLLDPADFMSVFEWVLDPDGNPETTDDMPDVINNSWGYDYNLAIMIGACEMQEAEILQVIETAGICSPFSAGNEGPGAATNGFPAMIAYNEVNCMSIGAVNGNVETYPIADFSSRGPTPCISEEGPLQIKPEVVAPGYNVRSASGHNSYEFLSGTSMACPHVSGALLLLREAFPNASAYELKYALYTTASDLGEPGEDNTFGNGMIDVLAAYQYLAMTYTPAPPVNNGFDISCELQMPEEQVYCPEDAVFDPVLRITNNGTETVSDLKITARYNGIVVFDAIPNLLLLPGASTQIDLPQLTGIAGKNEVYASAIHTEQSIMEYNMYDNHAVHYFNVLGEHELQYTQPFDTFTNSLTNSDWFIINTDMGKTWDMVRWDTENDNRALCMNFYNYLPREGQHDDVLSPQILLPDTGNISLNFLYAYKKRMETLFKDSLIVLLSTDCGASYPYELWRIGGVDMATVSGNAGNNGFVPATSADWDTVQIDLNDFKNNNIVICLRAHNDSGSALYVDDFSITVESSSEIAGHQYKNDWLIFYPNPAGDMLYFDSNRNCDQYTLRIYDSSGRLVLSHQHNINTAEGLNISTLHSGLYIVEMLHNDTIISARFVKQ